MKDQFINLLKERIKFKNEQLNEYQKQLNDLEKNKPLMEFSIMAFRIQTERIKGRIEELYFIMEEYKKMKGGLRK